MELNDLAARAMEIRGRYEAFERRAYGREWNNGEIALGFVGDVGDLVKLVQAKEGVRPTDDLDEKLAHELSDCLWSVLVLADKYGVDLEQEFLKTMDELDGRLGEPNVSYRSIWPGQPALGERRRDLGR